MDTQACLRIYNLLEDHGCPICISGVSPEHSYITDKCVHLFHKKCIIEHFKYSTRCPTCNTENTPHSPRSYSDTPRLRRRVITSPVLIANNTNTSDNTSPISHSHRHRLRRLRNSITPNTLVSNNRNSLLISVNVLNTSLETLNTD